MFRMSKFDTKEYAEINIKQAKNLWQTNFAYFFILGFIDMLCNSRKM